MNYSKKLLRRINTYQQKHDSTAFIIAVIKKYSDDSTGRQAALLTYYSFLSLFPLLLVLTTITNAIVSKGGHLRTTIINGLTNYFPLLGNQLSSSVHTIHTSGFALFAGLLFTLYGARGVANAFTRGVQDMWMVPKRDRHGFPQTLYRSLALIIIGGTGFVVASIVASLISAGGHGLAFRLLYALMNLFILFWLFSFLLKFSLPRHITLGEISLGAGVAAVGLMILQGLGGYILAHELKHLDAVYSYFAVALGLLFWLYLQTQVLYYAIEISIVSSKKLWPRSLESSYPTPVDQMLSASNQVR